MFYIKIIEKIHMSCHTEPIDGAVEVNDDIENFKLYFYDSYSNEITKRIPVEYECEESNGSILIHFTTDRDLLISISYDNVLNNNVINTSKAFLLSSVDGVATLELEIEVDGVINIVSLDKYQCFDSLSIYVDEKVDNEYNPSINVLQNKVTVGRSTDYMRLLSLQKEIESIKEILHSNGLVTK